MDGRPVFKWAVRLLDDSSRQVLAAAGFKTSDVGVWMFHQANIRILDAAADALDIDRAKIETHIDRYGNTSAGSVPIALDEALRRPLRSRRFAADVRIRRRPLLGHRPALRW